MISLPYIYDFVEVILGHFAEFIRTLVYELDLWLYPNAILPWLSILLQDLFIYYFY